MTIANEILRLQTAKNNIKTAIEAKGVPVNSELKLDAYSAKIAEISGGSGGSGPNPPSPYVRPVDWIDISNVADNEINLLVTQTVATAFYCNVAGGGTYAVDWGDGLIETGLTSGSIAVHQHTTGGIWCSGGYYTWKVKIYATNIITAFKIARHTYTNRRQESPILWANFGTTGITDYSYAFYYSSNNGCYCTKLREVQIPALTVCSNTGYMFSYCYSLNSITLPATWGNVTNTGYMFNGCFSLNSITLPATWGNVTNTGYMFGYCYSLNSITLPATWGNVTNTGYMFYYCYSLNSITLPATWGNISSTSNMFQFCYSLNSITLPATWGNVSNAASMFSGCYSLNSITLPATWGNVSNASSMFSNCYSLNSITLPATWGNISITSSMFYYCYSLNSITLPATWGNISSTSNMFNGCYSLKEIINSEYFGTTGSTQCDMTDTFRDCEYLQGVITIGSRLTKFGAYGASNYLLKLTGIRLINTNSTFTGSSPQINVSYTSMGQSSLVDLFNDLPALAGKSIAITGCPGAVLLTAAERAIATNKGWTITG